MPVQFYEFDRQPFRDQLLECYIWPAVEWFLAEPSGRYLLPKISGSHWECALAIESLSRILELDDRVAEGKRKQIEDACVATTVWLLERARQEPVTGQLSWDGVTWDTAVCLRAILSIEEKFGVKWSKQTREYIYTTCVGALRWLASKVRTWDRDVRYPAGPPDLAQILNTLSLLPDRYANLQLVEGGETTEQTRQKIAKLLLAMGEERMMPLPDGEATVFLWVDCFNTSEVIEGLSSYLRLCSKVEVDQRPDFVSTIEQSIFRAVRYIEISQSEGTWGGVADTCGTLYGYLKVVNSMDGIEPDDHIVFQALRWMCDEKQALSDGSFLHTSYVTVFFLHALLEAYAGWRLGHEPGPVVYDIALWVSPAQATVERSKRLDLQIRLENVEEELQESVRKLDDILSANAAAVALVFQLLVLFLILVVTESISFSVSEANIDLLDPNRFWTVLGLGVSVMLVVTPIVVRARRRNRIRSRQLRDHES